MNTKKYYKKGDKYMHNGETCIIDVIDYYNNEFVLIRPNGTKCPSELPNSLSEDGNIEDCNSFDFETYFYTYNKKATKEYSKHEIMKRERERKKNIYLNNLTLLAEETEDRLNQLEIDFNEEAENCFNIQQKKGYKPKVILEIVEKMGAVDAARYLISYFKRKPSSGFMSLVKFGLAQYSIQALVVKPKYAELFSDKEIEICKYLLRTYAGTTHYPAA